MKRLMATEAAIACLGAALGHRLWGWLPLDVHFILVAFLGGLAAIGTTLTFQAIRKSDDLAKVSGLDAERKAKFVRTAAKRRAIIKHRWLVALFTGLGAAAMAAALKAPLAGPYQMYLIWGSYGLVTLAVVCNVAQFIEHEKLTDLILKTEALIQKENDDREFFRGVTA